MNDQNKTFVIARIVGLNLVLLGVYKVFLALIIHDYLAITEMIVTGVHAITLFVLVGVFFGNDRKMQGIGVLISFLIVSTIGASSCAYIWDHH